jgi:hypothetical protein
VEIVHLGVFVEGTVRLLCGERAGAKSWTTLPRLVTCPHCRARMEAAAR